MLPLQQGALLFNLDKYEKSKVAEVGLEPTTRSHG